MKGQARDPIWPIISKIAGDKHSVAIEHLWEIAPGISNGHVTDYVIWPWTVKVATQIYLDANISKTVEGRDSVPMMHK